MPLATPDHDLIASYWTIAGDSGPFDADGSSPHGFRERVAAAARAGFRGVGLNHADLAKLLARHGAAEMKAILADHGMRHLELEFINDWFAEGERRRVSDAVRNCLFDGAARLGVHHIKVGGDFGGGAWPMGRMVEEFHRLCEEAAAVGAPIALEIMPWTNLCTIDMVLQVVQGAGHRNGGIALDIWHLARGGIPFADIARVPPELIFFVEIDDADAQQEGTLLEDTIYRRRLCGEGDLDVPGFLREIRATGYRGPIGVEIIATAQRALPLEVAAQRSFATAAAQFAGLGAG